VLILKYYFICSDCDIDLFPQIPDNGVEVTIDPLALNTAVNYECMDPTNFFIRGPPTSNMCDNMGMYSSATAPTCERGKRFQSCVNKTSLGTLVSTKPTS